MKFRTILLLLLFLSSVAFALSPPPGGFKEKPLEEVWAESDEVIFGKIVKLTLLNDDESHQAYQATIAVEKVWKGKTKTTQTVIESLPDGSGMGFEFRLGARYVFFLDRHPDVSDLIRIQATHYNLKVSTFEVFGDPDGMAKLRKFLESKEALSGRPTNHNPPTK